MKRVIVIDIDELETTETESDSSCDDEDDLGVPGVLSLPSSSTQKRVTNLVKSKRKKVHRRHVKNKVVPRNDNASDFRSRRLLRKVRLQCSGNIRVLRNRVVCLKRRPVLKKRRRQPKFKNVVPKELEHVSLVEIRNCLSDLHKMAHGPEDTVIQIGIVPLSVSVIDTLKPNKLVMCGIVDSFLQLICDRSKLNPTFPKVHAFLLYFSVQFQEQSYAYNDIVRTWFEDVNVFAYDIVFFPIYIASRLHFTLVTMNKRQRSMIYYDSLGRTNNKLMDGFMKLLQHIHIDLTGKPIYQNWNIVNVKGPIQGRYTNNCAIFLCRVAEFLSLSKNADISKANYIKEENMWYFRERLVWELAHGTILHP